MAASSVKLSDMPSTTTAVVGIASLSAALYLVSNPLKSARVAFVTLPAAASISAMIASTAAFLSAFPFPFDTAGTDATGAIGAAADAFAFVDTRRVTAFPGFFLFVQVMTLSLFFAFAGAGSAISLYYLPPKETRTGFL
jgi:hypothetical protein